MKDIAKDSDIRSIIIDVSQKILEKNIKKFVYTSLKLNNINYNSSNTIYCIFLEYSNQYQIFIFDNKFKYMIFELLHTKKEVSTEFTLYITKDSFVIFQKNKIYTYQKINQEYSQNELLKYINKNFNITIKNVVHLDDFEIEKIIEKNLISSNISNLKNINEKSKKVFLLYLSYIFVCIGASVGYKNYEELSYTKDIQKKQEIIKNEYLKTLKTLKFKPYEEEYNKLINTVSKYGLELISLNYTSTLMKIKVQSKDKNNIYLFLKYYQKNLVSNSISEVSSKKIFTSILNVKINNK